MTTLCSALMLYFCPSTPRIERRRVPFLTGEPRHGGTEPDDPRRPESTADSNLEVLENGPSEVISFPLCFHRGELFGPVQARTRVDLGVVILQMQLRAVAVGLDLVDPVFI